MSVVNCRHYLLLTAILAIALQLKSLTAAERPNVLLILCDDMGYSDLGCYGSEIHTPHLDSLAHEGLRFTQMYNTARCWPTRAALLTGYYAQQVRRDVLEGIPSGNRGTRPDWAPLVPDLLHSAGYRCYHSGKWHLDGMPLKTGFDKSYYLQDQGRFFNPLTHYQDDVKLPAVAKGSNYYGTSAIAEHCLTTLQQHAKEHPDEPFFHYLAFTAPHFPLHALPEDIAKYQGRYDEGWEVVRQQRRDKQIELGILPETELSEPEESVGPPYHFPDAFETLGRGEINRPLPWSKLTNEQKAFQSTKMSLHAAMIDRVDQEVGRVIAFLKETNQFDNTLILFLSDNGASAEIMVRADGHNPEAPPGSAESYLCLGPGWSTVCNTPFRRHKTWVHEGGISTPLVVSWPAAISGHGELRATAAHVIDIVPTLLEVCGAVQIQTRNPEDHPRPGHSLKPLFNRDGSIEHKEIWWQHEGNRAFRRGDWKIVAAGEDAPWELYNITKDRDESENLASAHSDLVKDLSQEWQKQLDGFRAEFTAE